SPDDHLRHAVAGRVGLKPFRKSVGEQRDVRMFDGSIDAQHLRVRLRVHQTRKSVACIAADAEALSRVLFIELDSKRSVKRSQSQSREVITQMLNARFVTDRRMRVSRARTGIGRVFPSFSMNVIELFGLSVIRF